MTMATRTGPLHDASLASAAAWRERSGMRVVEAHKREGDPATLALADLSHLVRMGLKGPGAAAWLASQGVETPGAPNAWRALPGERDVRGIVARLAATEFLVEDDGGRATALEAALGHGMPDVYPVLRQDCALALMGQRANDVLLQVCSVDFASLLAQVSPQGGPLALTSMAGVSVLVVPQRAADDTPLFRIWCDPTFGAYLHRTLLDIVAEEGGGPVGLARLAHFLHPNSEGP
jgi:sarcosine oxidase subunit gamma